MLTLLGSKELEEQVYMWLLHTPSRTAAQLGRALQRRAADITAALSELEVAGLVARNPGRPVRYVAAPPDVAVSNLLLERQAQLARARTELDHLVRRYHSQEHVRRVDELVEIVIGAEPIAQRVLQLSHKARTEYLTFIKPPFVAIDIDRAIEAAVDADDTPARQIHDAAVVEYPGYLDRILSALTPNEENRIHPNLPMKLVIADRQTALLPLADSDSVSTPAVVVVHASGLVNALTALFEQYWEASQPFGIEHADAAGQSAVDRQILSLLMAGSTDEAIARQLGVSTRTVLRRVRAMMAAANASTRIQLGWHAARNDWL